MLHSSEMKEILYSMPEAEMDYDGDGGDARVGVQFAHSIACTHPGELQQVVDLGRPVSRICHAMCQKENDIWQRYTGHP